MRENMLSRWVVRLAIAGSIGAGAAVIGAAPAVAAPRADTLKSVADVTGVVGGSALEAPRIQPKDWIWT